MIAHKTFWLSIALLALGTFAIRFSLISISGRVVITPRTKELFSYIPAAILPALVAPMVFFHQGSAQWALGKERGLALALAIVVCAVTRSTLITILFGLVLLYIFRIL